MTSSGGGACSCGTVFQLVPPTRAHGPYEHAIKFSGGADGGGPNHIDDQQVRRFIRNDIGGRCLSAVAQRIKILLGITTIYDFGQGMNAPLVTDAGDLYLTTVNMTDAEPPEITD